MRKLLIVLIGSLYFGQIVAEDMFKCSPELVHPQVNGVYRRLHYSLDRQNVIKKFCFDTQEEAQSSRAAYLQRLGQLKAIMNTPLGPKSFVKKLSMNRWVVDKAVSEVTQEFFVDNMKGKIKLKDKIKLGKRMKEEKKSHTQIRIYCYKSLNEAIPGMDLSDYVQLHGSELSALNFMVIYYLLQNHLHTLENMKVIHQDIKLDNIMLVTNPRVGLKFIDWDNALVFKDKARVKKEVYQESFIPHSIVANPVGNFYSFQQHLAFDRYAMANTIVMALLHIHYGRDGFSKAHEYSEKIGSIIKQKESVINFISDTFKEIDAQAQKIGKGDYSEHLIEIEEYVTKIYLDTPDKFSDKRKRSVQKGKSVKRSKN